MRFRVLIIAFFLPFSLLAQLSAPGSKSVRYTSYQSSSAKDPIFFYCNALGTEKGTLTAVRTAASGLYDFSWHKWNSGTGEFDIDIATETGVAASTVDNLDGGGYKVEIDSSGVEVEEFTGWIFFDTPPVAEAGLEQQLCYRVALKGRADATTPSFFYYDPGNSATITQSNSITFLWSSEPASVIPYPDLVLNPVSYSPPLEDVTYKLEVNSLGCRSESSFFYNSIHVKADFTVVPTDGEAPLEVSVTDNSTRGDIYKWDFGDDTSSLKDPPPHIYYKPGEYSILLTIESNLHCIDSLRSEIIVVDPSSLDIPNVFTPDDDGYNDRFRIEASSLRFVSMEIFSQSGMKVYGFSGDGDRLKGWEGWDGRINNSSIEARPGIYFYIIRAFGWDDIKYDSKEYRGFVYLYR